jgi:hypothetical protein
VPTWSAGYADDEATSERPASSDTPSTGKPGLATRSGLRAVLGQAVRTVTNAVAVIAADATEQQFGLWRADKDDVDGISGPASRIVYRRLPDEARDSDALDLFGIGLAIAAYVAKQLKLKADLRAARAAGQLVDVDQHAPQSDDPPASASPAWAWPDSPFTPGSAAAPAS